LLVLLALAFDFMNGLPRCGESIATWFRPWSSNLHCKPCCGPRFLNVLAFAVFHLSVCEYRSAGHPQKSIPAFVDMPA